MCTGLEYQLCFYLCFAAIAKDCCGDCYIIFFLDFEIGANVLILL
jgi:hypothetical protein